MVGTPIVIAIEKRYIFAAGTQNSRVTRARWSQGRLFHIADSVAVRGQGRFKGWRIGGSVIDNDNFVRRKRLPQDGLDRVGYVLRALVGRNDYADPLGAATLRLRPTVTWGFEQRVRFAVRMPVVRLHRPGSLKR